MRPLLVAGCFLWGLAALSALGEGLPEGAQDVAGKLVFGQSAALSGPASELGAGMRLGLLAAFAEVNRQGGIRGPSAGSGVHG